MATTAGTNGSDRGRIGDTATNQRAASSAAGLLHGRSLESTRLTANAVGQTHSHGVFYDPATGKLQVSRDGVTLGSCADSTPLITGSYLSLRTDAARVQFEVVSLNCLDEQPFRP